MRVRLHLIIFGTTFVMWLLFYILGSPFNYFLDFNNHEILNLMFITFFAVVPFITVFMLSIFGKDYVKESFWVAFYASVPLFVYDYIMVGVVQGEGLNFLRTHWFLTAGYFLVWIFIPAIGLTMSKLTSSKK